MTYHERFNWFLDALETWNPDFDLYTHVQINDWLSVCIAWVKDGTLPPGMVGHPPPHPL